MRRRFPRAKLQATLVEYLEGRRSAPFREIAERVHGDRDTSGDAIEKRVDRTSESLLIVESLVRFRCGSERAFKETRPE